MTRPKYYTPDIITLVSQIVEHTEIDEHLGRISQNLIL